MFPERETQPLYTVSLRSNEESGGMMRLSRVGKTLCLIQSSGCAIMTIQKLNRRNEKWISNRCGIT